MNNERRKRLDVILSSIEQLKADLEMIKDEEQEAYDNMPDGLKEGKRGEKAQAAIDAMERADGSMDEIVSYIETAKE